jgi:hypothetical protein
VTPPGPGTPNVAALLEDAAETALRVTRVSGWRGLTTALSTGFTTRGNADGTADFTKAPSSVLLGAAGCPATCVVRITPELSVATAAGSRAKAGATKRYKLKTVRIKVPAGGVAVVKVRLTSSARRALQKAGKATLRVTAKVGSAGKTATKRSTLRLRIVKPKRRR